MFSQLDELESSGSGDLSTNLPREESPDADAADPDDSDDANATSGQESAAGGAADNQGNGERATAPSVAQVQAVALETDALDALAPDHLASAENVMPKDLGGDGDLSQRLSVGLDVWDAALSVSEGFCIKGDKIPIKLDLGNLAAQLDGGYLGGSVEGDTVVATLDVPYLYPVDDDGSLRGTYSYEEWAIRTARADAARKAVAGDTAEEVAGRALEEARSSAVAAQAPRVAVYADSVPEGWSAWRLCAGGLEALDDEDFIGGATGRLVFRYEGGESDAEGNVAERDGRLDAAAVMPQLTLGFSGRVPEGAAGEVLAGYEAHSYTDKFGKTTIGTAQRRSGASLVVVNREASMQGHLAVEAASKPEVAKGSMGWATHYVRLNVPEGAPKAQGYAVSVGYPADAQGRSGLTVQALRFKEAESAEDGIKAGDDASRQYIGVPGQGGLVVLDVTDLSDEQRASLNPADPSSLEEAGVECLPYTVGETGRIVVSRPDDAIESGAERVLLVCAPFADANLIWGDNHADGAMSAALSMTVEARLAVREASTSYEYLLREETSFKFAHHEAPVVDGTDSNGSMPENSGGLVEGGDSDETENEPNRTEDTEGRASSMLSTNSFLPRFQDMLPSLSALALYGSQTDEELREALYVTTSATAMAGSLSPLPGTADTYMIGNNDDVVVNINFRSQVESILFGTGVTPQNVGDPATILVEIPYFYRDADGFIRETTSYEQYCELMEDPAIAALNPDWQTNPMRMMMTPTQMSSLFTDYIVYDPEFNVIVNNYWDADGLTRYRVETESGEKILALSGTFEFRAREPMESSYIYPPDMGVKFSSNVPENTGGTYKVGARATSYIDTNVSSDPQECSVVIEPGDQSDHVTRRITFIKSNLQWTSQVQGLTPDQVLWDRYNYHAYKVTIENTSTSPDTPIDIVGFSLKVPDDMSETGGITKDYMASFKADGTPISAPLLTDQEFTSGSFIGKPNAGGVLIYDVTDQDSSAESWGGLLGSGGSREVQ